MRTLPHTGRGPLPVDAFLKLGVSFLEKKGGTACFSPCVQVFVDPSKYRP